MTDQIVNELSVKDGNKVVLYDRLDMESIYGREQCARNVYLIDASAQVIWQVYSEYDSEGNPFTNISVDDLGNITAYRWDGGLYFINENIGFAKPQKLIK
ncbi:hypothetical protein ACE2AK_26270 [Rahnella perminowiae]|uniref:Uncharacterized protein n=1 Tax=Rahnella perminowiae TaxID=2816244 RepID=A0ABS6KZA0_9GAMM|nr:hypothetical protein [Rahnella perminowiae]MBU9834390.1 hypothetical protein [Rahnella perminowiae]MCR9001562.1 hypothetical protein [Rahnella perminowiae]UJD89242.1 hypothetical protein FS594_10825 [Rahnella aquatilis]